MGVNHQMAVSDADALELESWLERTDLSERLRTRARVVLMSADLVHPEEIATQLGVDRKSVYKWRRRYREGGLPNLRDKTGPGGNATTADKTVRFALRAEADKLLADDTAPSYDDVKRFCLLGLRETPDDDPRAQYASHGKLKVAWTQLLVDVLKQESDGEDVESLLGSL